MTKPVDKAPNAKVLKNQPKLTPNLTVTQVTSVGGTVTDLCAHCSHMTTKVITNQTTCQCCKNGHSGF